MKQYPTYAEFREALSDIDEWDLKDRWVIGGQSGGSCWDEGESSHYAIDAEDEPEQEVLDNVLDRVFPSLTFKEYRKLLKAEVYSYEKQYQSEYYGNYTRYMNRELNLEKLWVFLTDVEEERHRA